MKVKNWEIRLSHKEDASSMMELENLVWTKGTTPAEIQFDSEAEFLEKNPPGSKTVAVLDGKVVGILGYHAPHSLKAVQHVLELDIAVHPAYQKQGIAGQLMDALKEMARKNGVKKLQLRVLSTNEKAIHFYQKNGFHKEGVLEKQFLLDGAYVDDIFMAYFL